MHLTGSLISFIIVTFFACAFHSTGSLIVCFSSISEIARKKVGDGQLDHFSVRLAYLGDHCLQGAGAQACMHAEKW